MPDLTLDAYQALSPGEIREKIREEHAKILTLGDKAPVRETALESSTSELTPRSSATGDSKGNTKKPTQHGVP